MCTRDPTGSFLSASVSDLEQQIPLSKRRCHHKGYIVNAGQYAVIFLGQQFKTRGSYRPRQVKPLWLLGSCCKFIAIYCYVSKRVYFMPKVVRNDSDMDNNCHADP